MKTPFGRLFRAAAVAVTLWCAWTAHGQGVQVNFSNRSLSNPCGAVFAPVYGINPCCPDTQFRGNATTNGGTVDYSGVPLLAGAGFTAALFGGPEGTAVENLQVLATTTFSTATALRGIFNGGNVTVAWMTPGSRPVFQIRVWDNRFGTIATWWDAQGADAPHGSSAPFSPPCPALLPGQTQTIYLAGLTSFNLHLLAFSPYCGGPDTNTVLGALGGNVTLDSKIKLCGDDGILVTQQWLRAGFAIPNATNRTLTLSNLRSSDAGEYTFLIGHPFGSFYARTFRMNLLVPPRLTGIQFQPPQTAALNYEAGTNISVSIQTATALSNWLTLHTGPAVGQFQDTNATNMKRLYRLRLEP